MSTTEQAVENLLNEERLDGEDLQRRLDRRPGDDRHDRARHGRGTRRRRGRERGVRRGVREVGRAGTARLGGDAADRARSRSCAGPGSSSSCTGPRSSAGWCARSGAIDGKADDEIGASIGQLEKAASITADQLEQELTSPVPGRTSTARRAAARRRRRDHALELPARPRDAVARARARARQRGRAQGRPRTRPSRGGVLVARIFEEAGLPSGVLHVLCGGAEVGAGAGRGSERADDLVHRLDRRPGARSARPQAGH